MHTSSPAPSLAPVSSGIASCWHAYFYTFISSKVCIVCVLVCPCVRCIEAYADHRACNVHVAHVQMHDDGNTRLNNRITQCAGGISINAQAACLRVCYLLQKQNSSVHATGSGSGSVAASVVAAVSVLVSIVCVCFPPASCLQCCTTSLYDRSPPNISSAEPTETLTRPRPTE